MRVLRKVKPLLSEIYINVLLARDEETLKPTIALPKAKEELSKKITSQFGNVEDGVEKMAEELKCD